MSEMTKTEWFVTAQDSNFDDPPPGASLHAWIRIWHIPSGLTYQITGEAVGADTRWSVAKWLPGNAENRDICTRRAVIAKLIAMLKLNSWADGVEALIKEANSEL